MYQLLALKHKNSVRWTKVDVLSNAATNPSLEKVLNLLRNEGWSVPIEIHNYSDPSIGFDEIDRLFQSIEVEPGKNVAICPGLGPDTDCAYAVEDEGTVGLFNPEDFPTQESTLSHWRKTRDYT